MRGVRGDSMRVKSARRAEKDERGDNMRVKGERDESMRSVG